MRIGVIGGSGLYEVEGLKVKDKVKLVTPFGEPSDEYVLGELEGIEVIFLPRHGRGHRISPSEINYRANICGFKILGAEAIISFSAVGSLKEEIKPGDIVIVSQFFDRTRRRPYTFFEGGVVAHVSVADPVCPVLSEILFESARELGLSVHKGGTYVCIEGPQFSTKAESMFYRSLGFDVIGMTNVPEYKLAREAEICFATVALVTDYDVWHASEEPVTVEVVMKRMEKLIEDAKRIMKKALPRIARARFDCGCRNALENAIVTDLKQVPKHILQRLRPIIGKYLEK